MKILALERELPGTSAVQFRQHAKAEAARAWQLVQRGIFREMYFHRDDHYAVIVLECADVADAVAALGTLPYVREGLITFEVIPLVPYSGFERLFAQEATGQTPEN